LFISILRAASWCQPLQDNPRPRGAVIGPGTVGVVAMVVSARPHAAVVPVGVGGAEQDNTGKAGRPVSRFIRRFAAPGIQSTVMSRVGAIGRMVVPALAGALALAVAGCGSEGAERNSGTGRGGSGRDNSGRVVQVTPAVEERLVRSVSVTGTLAAEEQVTLSLKVTGRLDELFVDLGSRVSKGQVIARLVPTDFTLRVQQSEAALRQARARLGLPPEGDDVTVDPDRTAIVRQAKAVLDEAKLTRERTETFVKRGIAARADLDAAEAALQVADSRHQDALEEVRNRQALLDQRRSELELAQQALRDTQLTASLDGMVRERHVTVGQYVAAGTPVVTIVRVHPLRLRAAVPERDAQAIRIGQVTRVRVEGDDQTHEGRVARVSPAIDETTRTLMIEAEVPNSKGLLRPGSFANADIVMQGEERAVLVPTSALVTFAGVDKVLVVKEGRVSERRVTTGRRENGRTEIVAGLASGEPVIVQPGNLVEGEPVRVANASAAAIAPAAAK
jgi:RND family efflux transporter MFP subunit